MAACALFSTFKSNLSYFIPYFFSHSSVFALMSKFSDGNLAVIIYILFPSSQKQHFNSSPQSKQTTLSLIIFKLELLHFVQYSFVSSSHTSQNPNKDI